MNIKNKFQRLGDLLSSYYDRTDRSITGWMAFNGLTIMRLGLGVVFLWFGALKLVPGLSPAEDLVRSSIFFVDPDTFQPLLAVWEMVIGIGLLSGKYLRATLFLLFAQMVGTALPLVALPERVWTAFPYGLTLEGQYIIKNLVLIGAALVLGGTVRGGRLVAEPQ
ncbi:MAG: DoxX family membrane protein [Anaerolineales bacterium]